MNTTVNMTCPTCGPVHSEVTDSRPDELDGDPTIKRRRRCTNCGAKVVTYEVTEFSASKHLQHAIARVIHELVDQALNKE